MATGAACPTHGGTTCQSCDDGYYLSGGACVAQPYCGAGQKISAYSTTKAGVCGPCGTDEYQEAKFDALDTSGNGELEREELAQLLYFLWEELNDVTQRKLSLVTP